METAKQPSRGRKWKGLLVVTVLVVVITGVTIKDALQSARESANQRQCLSNLKELWSASMMYAQDYGGWMPVYTNSNDPSGRGNVLKGFSSPEKLHSSLSKYVKNQSAWFCRSALSAGKDTGVGFDCRYSNYDFHFCKPGVLRSDGPHNVSSMVMRLAGKPSLYALIMDQRRFLTRVGGKSGGPHPDGVMNVIYLDGHIDKICLD